MGIIIAYIREKQMRNTISNQWGGLELQRKLETIVFVILW